MDRLKEQYDALLEANTFEALGIAPGFIDRMLDLEYVLTPAEETYIAVQYQLEDLEKMLWPDEA